MADLLRPWLFLPLHLLYISSSVFCADLSSMIGVGAAEVHLLNVCNGSVFSLFGSALAMAVAVASRLAGGAVA